MRRTTAIWRKRAAGIAFGLLAGQWSAAATGLKWDATEVPLALRWNADSGIARFTFVNEGPGQVKITDVTPGCECTAALLSKTTFAAGENGEIAVEFKAGNRTGSFRIPIAVQTDEPAGATTLLLIATIEDAITFDSRFIYWPKAEPRGPRRIRIKAVNGLLVAFGGIEVENPVFSAKLEPDGPGGREFDLVVTPPAGELAAFSSIVLRARLGEAKIERVYTLLARTL
jgi:Protein of unknown function (DUF1573)